MTLRNCAKLYQHPALLQELFQNLNYCSLHALPRPPPLCPLYLLLWPLPVQSCPCTIYPPPMLYRLPPRPACSIHLLATPPCSVGYTLALSPPCSTTLPVFCPPPLLHHTGRAVHCTAPPCEIYVPLISHCFPLPFPLPISLVQIGANDANGGANGANGAHGANGGAHRANW